MSFLRWDVLGLGMLVACNVFADCGNMPVGFHEFAIYGKQDVYLSHYPMFSSIHSYQIILKGRLEGEGDPQRKFLEHRSQHPDLHYTFSPYRAVPPSPDRQKDQEDWVLPEKTQAGQQFNGDIHYRKDGKDVTLIYNAKLIVENTIYSHLFDPKESRPNHLSYVEYGTNNERYLSHLVSAPPNPGEEITDFDQILSVETTVPAPTTYRTYHIPGKQNLTEKKLKKGDKAVLVSADNQKVEMRIESEILNLEVSTQR